MDNKAIIEKINNIPSPESGYYMFWTNDYKSLYGRDAQNNIVFMLPSASPNLSILQQETRSLSFIFNKKCLLTIDGDQQQKKMHVLVCKERSADKIDAFIRLTHAFSQNEFGGDQYYLAKLFSSISNLFLSEKTCSEIELQGLYAELYVILYLKKNGADIAQSWQSKNKMKFDFSFNGQKRLEIKSTTKPNRIHHFKHEQLLSQLYDIKFVSMQLQKNDCGMSLLDLISEIRAEYEDNFALLLRIDSAIANIDTATADSIKYDNSFSERHIRFYDAKLIPHFNEQTPEGVFNAEYDCALDNVATMPLKEVIEWIKERN